MGSPSLEAPDFHSLSARRSRRDPGIRTPRLPARRSERRLLPVSSRGGDVDRRHLVADLHLVQNLHPRSPLAEMVVDAACLEEWGIADRDEELRAAYASRARGHAGGAARPL